MKALSSSLSVVAIVFALAASTARAEDVVLGVDLQLGGGSVLAWDNASDTGNAFGGALLLDVDDFAVGFGAAAVMSDSRLQARFGTYWLEGRWHFLGGDALLSPYAVAGVGFATFDDFELLPDGGVPARWSSEMNVVAMLGAGARFGRATGMYLALDVRAWNHTHLGFQLAAGFRFF